MKLEGGDGLADFKRRLDGEQAGRSGSLCGSGEGCARRRCIAGSVREETDMAWSVPVSGG
jgi:hypothetical protein